MALLRFLDDVVLTCDDVTDDNLSSILFASPLLLSTQKFIVFCVLFGYVLTYVSVIPV